jgi:class 3 adenylate cyclase
MGHILVSQRVFSRVEHIVVAESVGELALRGFHRLVPAYNIVRLAVNSSPSATPESC